MLLNTLVEGTARVSLVSQSGANFLPLDSPLWNLFGHKTESRTLLLPHGFTFATYFGHKTESTTLFGLPAPGFQSTSREFLMSRINSLTFSTSEREMLTKLERNERHLWVVFKYFWKYWEEKVTNKRHLWVVQDICENIEKKRWQTKRHLWVVLCEDCHRPISSWTLEGCPVLHFVPGDGTPTFLKFKKLHSKRSLDKDKSWYPEVRSGTHLLAPASAVVFRSQPYWWPTTAPTSQEQEAAE